MQREVLKSVLDERAITEALVSMIPSRNLLFRAAEWSELHALMKTANPALDREMISSHSTVAKKIWESWGFSKDLVRKRLRSAMSKIHFSVDIWTSLNKKQFLGICVHFVDRETQRLLKALIGLRPMITHKGSEQSVLIASVLGEYDILKKLGYVIGDNHGSNDTLCRSLQSHLLEKEIEWDAATHRIRCIGHILNLAVQYFLFGNGNDTVASSEVDEVDEDDGSDKSAESDESGAETTRGKKSSTRGKKGWRKMGPLRKLHNIAVFIRSSVPRFNDFESLAHRSLPLDNSTRWNSWHEMLSVAIAKSVVDAYSKKWFNNLKEDYLSPEDWTFLHEIEKFLQPFHRATLETEGGNSTIDRLLWTMDILSKHYDNSLV